MARWTASAKWAAGPALDGQRDMPLALRLSEGLGVGATPAAMHTMKAATGSEMVAGLWKPFVCFDRGEMRNPGLLFCGLNLKCRG